MPKDKITGEEMYRIRHSRKTKFQSILIVVLFAVPALFSMSLSFNFLPESPSFFQKFISIVIFLASLAILAFSIQTVDWKHTYGFFWFEFEKARLYKACSSVSEELYLNKDPKHSSSISKNDLLRFIQDSVVEFICEYKNFKSLIVDINCPFNWNDAKTDRMKIIKIFLYAELIARPLYDTVGYVSDNDLRPIVHYASSQLEKYNNYEWRSYQKESEKSTQLLLEHMDGKRTPELHYLIATNFFTHMGHSFDDSGIYIRKHLGIEDIES